MFFNYYIMQPELLQYIITAVVIICFVAVVAAFIYRFVEYGIKIKAGPVEIDASDENKEEEKVNAENKD